MAKFLEYLHDHANIVKYVFFIFLIGTVVFDFFAERHEAHFWGDHIFGFWTIFGIFGCLGMIVICKGIAHAWLMKDENFYDK
ncbi:MAG: hypothetical protein HQK77_04580 [Desulfobacterales bacterium]|nr:hypothetical protein [Desulfobacterales bacterium]